MTLDEALKFAEQCKQKGNISTSAKALIILAEEYKTLHRKLGHLESWLGSRTGWYVKDYADGWIYFDDEQAARKEADEMGGALIREVKDGVCKQL